MTQQSVPVTTSASAPRRRTVLAGSPRRGQTTQAGIPEP